MGDDQLSAELLACLDLRDRAAFHCDKRILSILSANILVTIPASNDRLVMHGFDVEPVLEKAGIDYLFVTSLLHAWDRKGAIYRYQIGTKSSKEGLQYRVVTGPAGLEVSKTGTAGKKIGWLRRLEPTRGIDSGTVGPVRWP